MKIKLEKKQKVNENVMYSDSAIVPKDAKRQSTQETSV
jgi:hypothetical protein